MGISKNKKQLTYLGVLLKNLNYIQISLWESWLNWNNHGLYNGEHNFGWDIDHIEPISNAKNEDDIIRLNHYINLRPLCSYTNRYIKRNKTLTPQDNQFDFFP